MARFAIRRAFLLAVLYALVTITVAAETERQAEIFVWPLSASKPQTFAKVSFTSNNASITSFESPSIASNDDIVRVGFHRSSSQWSGVATAAANFVPEKLKRLQLHVDTNGELYHVGFKTADNTRQGSGENTKDSLSVEVVKIQSGPVPGLNKPVVLSVDGTDEQKEPEKSFLQKYWWAIALFLVFQAVMGGQKE